VITDERIKEIVEEFYPNHANPLYDNSDDYRDYVADVARVAIEEDRKAIADVIENELAPVMELIKKCREMV